MYSLDDTIAAIASPAGGAARGIVRVSGPQARRCVVSCFRAADGCELAAAHVPTAVSGTIILPGIFSPIPADVFLWPAGRSYTGQAVTEIHTIGSPPLLELLLRTLCTTGARLADPGEFTVRAFLAGRIDLTQAEAVLGVIDAADPRELNVALTQLAGGLATPLHRLRDALLELLSRLEAGLDFAEEDISFIARDELERRLADAESAVAAILRQMTSRSQTADAMRMTLIGRPNTGKSSLFNALAGRCGAIVSEHPGTTRDYLLAELDLDGVRCQLVDTAGLPDEEGSVAEATDDIGQAAQSVAAEQRRSAHVQVLCIDSTRPLDPWERNELDSKEECRLMVLTKCDQPRQIDGGAAAIRTSSVTGQGIAALRSELRRAILVARGDLCDVVACTASRCFDSLRLADECLRRARGIAGGQRDELVAAEVRAALEELGKVVGAVYTEDVLQRIFSQFCIGK